MLETDLSKVEYPAKITGTFVDFSERTHEDGHLLDWSETDWIEELWDMRRAGITLAIPARTMRYGRTYYFSDFYETFDERDYLTPFMRAAAATGMKVYLSGMISDHFFQSDEAGFSRMMKRDVTIYETVLVELLEKFGNFPNVSGIYISHEADNENLGTPVRLSAAQEFFGVLYAKLKRRTHLPVMSSPFFTRSATPEELAAFWDELLDRPMFDIIAMQDGAGCDRDIGPEDLPAYFAALAPVFHSHGIELWHNCETFSFHPGYRASNYNRKKIWLHPAPLGRVSRQYELTRPHVRRTITWEYGHFLSRKQVGGDWYDAFRRWNLGLPDETGSDRVRTEGEI